MTNGYVTVGDGALYYEALGSGPSIVLVHGFGLDARIWDDQVLALQERCTVVRYDLRGFGRSALPKPGFPYTHVGDLLGLLDHLDIERATLAGLSLGGLIVLNTAVAAPRRVRSLVLLDSLLNGVRWDDNAYAAFKAAEQRAADGDVAAARELWFLHPFFDQARKDPQIAARLKAIVRDYTGFHWTHADPHPHWDPRIVESMLTLSLPTTVVVGEQDVPGFHIMAQILADRIPHAQKVVIPSAGHLVSMEAPEMITELLMAASSTSETVSEDSAHLGPD